MGDIDGTPLDKTADLVETFSVELAFVLTCDTLGVTELSTVDATEEAPGVTDVPGLELCTFPDGVTILGIVCEISFEVVDDTLDVSLVEVPVIERSLTTVGLRALAVSSTGLDTPSETLKVGVVSSTGLDIPTVGLKVGAVTGDEVVPSRGDTADVDPISCDKRSRET